MSTCLLIDANVVVQRKLCKLKIAKQTKGKSITPKANHKLFDEEGQAGLVSSV